MKIATIFLLVAAAIIVYTHAICPGQPKRTNCHLARSLGHTGRTCTNGTRWFWHQTHQRCEGMHYRGCGGNANRFCNKAACEHRCKRHRNHGRHG